MAITTAAILTGLATVGTGVATSLATGAASSLIGGGGGGTPAPAAKPDVQLNAGLMSPDEPSRAAGQAAFAVAEAYKGTNPYELLARVQGWMPKEEDK